MSDRSIQSTLTKADREAPFRESDIDPTPLIGPTRLEVDWEELETEAVYSETDPVSGYTLRVGSVVRGKRHELS